MRPNATITGMRGRDPRRLALLGLFCAGFLSVPAAPARADMASHFGLSPRAIGMGGAVSAVIDDYAAVYYNPGGLALSGSSGFTLGCFFATPRVRTREGNGPERLSFQNEMRTGLVGYRQNLAGLFPERWGRNIVVGMALAYPDNFKTGTLVRTRLYDEVQFPVFGRVPDMLVMSGGLGVEVFPGRLMIGAGMRYAVTYDAQNITAAIRLPENEVSYEKIDVNADTEIQPIVGLVFRPWDPLRLAAVWRQGGAPVHIVGHGRGTAVLGPVSLPINLNMGFQDFFRPEEFAGSVAWSPFRRWLLAFEVTYARWSAYDDPFGRKPPDTPFEDVLIPRFGVEYTPTGWLRVQSGYYWHPSPVGSDQPSTRYLDTDEHVFACAAEIAVPIRRLLQYPLLFHVYFQYQHLPRRTFRTVDGPTSIWGYITNIGGTVQLRF